MVTIPMIGIISSQAPKGILPMGKVQRSNGWAVAVSQLLKIRSFRRETGVGEIGTLYSHLVLQASDCCYNSTQSVKGCVQWGLFLNQPKFGQTLR